MIDIFLQNRDDAFYRQFFSSWTIDTVIRLGRVNRSLCIIVRHYIDGCCSAHQLLDPYVYDTKSFLNYIGICEAVIFGPSILHLLERHPTSSSSTIDICVDIAHSAILRERILREGYYDPREREHNQDFETHLKGTLLQMPCLKTGGDRLANPEGRGALEHRLLRRCRCGKEIVEQTFVLHIVRCRPMDHILSLSSSKLFGSNLMYISR